MDHRCRKNGKPVGALDGPGWASPGEIVKLADQEHWGRVELRWRCCDSYDVRVEQFGEQEAGVLTGLSERDLEPVYDRTEHAVPRGYPVPARPGGPRRV